jgi:DMSO/TMAO reductase YedYZ heme-binding membrane subunit
VTAWLLANRRYVGGALAASHTVHLLAIAVVARLDPTFTRSAGTLIGGGLAYALLYAMAATSSDSAVARLGRRRWKALHTTGMYYLWLLFVLSYLPRALIESRWYWLPAGALLAALALRAAAARRVT